MILFRSQYLGVSRSVLLLVVLGFVASSVCASSGGSLLSIQELSGLKGGNQAHVAVSWEGKLPVTLQAGLITDEGIFAPVGQARTLSERMTLLPYSEKASGDDIRWQVRDSDSTVLEQTTADLPPSGWQKEFFGPGLDAEVEAATIFNSDLVVAGRFATAGGRAVRRIARWDGTEWSAFSGASDEGFNDQVEALAVYDGDLYAGGWFTSAGGGPAGRVARWDGVSWLPLEGPSGDGIGSGIVHAITVFNGELVVAGDFNSLESGITVRNIARWDGNDWAALEGSTDVGVNDAVYSLAVFNGELVAGGDFTNAGGVFVDHVASWDGIQWGALDGPFATGLNATVLALSVFDSALVAGGWFTSAGGVAVEKIAIWNGTAWSALPADFPSGSSVHALSEYGGQLVVGGEFSEINGLQFNGVALWDGSSWSPLPGVSEVGVAYTYGGNDAIVSDFEVFGGSLVVVGNFNEAGGEIVNRIAKWNSGGWATIEGYTGNALAGGFSVNAAVVFNGELVVGGSFLSAGDSVVNSVATWNGQTWKGLQGPGGIGVEGGSFFGDVQALIVFDQELIVAGRFEEAGGIPADNIARWDGTTWAALQGVSGNGTDDSVRALSLYDGNLIVGGRFINAGGIASNHIAQWDGSDWSSLDGPLATGMNDGFAVNTLGQHDGFLIAGGDFDQAGGVQVNHIAKWDGTSWSGMSGPFSVGMSERVYALTNFEGDLVAGGLFSSAGGTGVRGIARWNGTEWSSLSGTSGTGVTNGRVDALTTIDGNLIVGGGFNSVSLDFDSILVEGIARWNGVEWLPLPGSVTGGQLVPFVQALEVFNEDLFVGGQMRFGASSTGDEYFPLIDRYVLNLDDTVLSVSSSMTPAITGQAVTYEVAVTGSLKPPGDGRVELMTVSSDPICTSTEPSTVVDNTAVFSCDYTWTEPGEKQLVALFRSSLSHDPGSAQFVQPVVDSEIIFLDGFQK